MRVLIQSSYALRRRCPQIRSSPLPRQRTPIHSTPPKHAPHKRVWCASPLTHSYCPAKQNNDTPLNNRLIGGLIAGEEAIYRIWRRMTCTPNKNHVPRLWRTEYWTLPSRMGLNCFSVSSNLLRHSLSSVSDFLKDSHGDVTQGHVSKSSSSLRNLVVKEGTLQIRSFKLTYNT